MNISSITHAAAALPNPAGPPSAFGAFSRDLHAMLDRSAATVAAASLGGAAAGHGAHRPGSPPVSDDGGDKSGRADVQQAMRAYARLA